LTSGIIAIKLLLTVPVVFQFGENFNRGTKFTVDTCICVVVVLSI